LTFTISAFKENAKNTVLIPKLWRPKIVRRNFLAAAKKNQVWKWTKLRCFDWIFHSRRL